MMASNFERDVEKVLRSVNMLAMGDEVDQLPQPPPPPPPPLGLDKLQTSLFTTPRPMRDDVYGMRFEHGLTPCESFTRRLKNEERTRGGEADIIRSVIDFGIVRRPPLDDRQSLRKTSGLDFWLKYDRDPKSSDGKQCNNYSLDENDRRSMSPGCESGARNKKHGSTSTISSISSRTSVFAKLFRKPSMKLESRKSSLASLTSRQDDMESCEPLHSPCRKSYSSPPTPILQSSTLVRRGSKTASRFSPQITSSDIYSTLESLFRRNSSSRRQNSTDMSRSLKKDSCSSRRLLSSETPPIRQRRVPFQSPVASETDSTSELISSRPEICAFCYVPLEETKKLKLQCGHDRCHSCVYGYETCLLCIGKGPIGGNFQSLSRGMTRTPRLPRLVRPTLRNRSQSPALLSIDGSPASSQMQRSNNSKRSLSADPNSQKIYDSVSGCGSISSINNLAVSATTASTAHPSSSSSSGTYEDSSKSVFQRKSNFQTIDQLVARPSPCFVTSSPSMKSKQRDHRHGSIAGSSSIFQNSVRTEDFTNPQSTGLRHPFWALSPLFFEVPQSDNCSGSQNHFVGRQWLFREILEHLWSDLPTNRGVIITGSSGTGKTEIIQQLVRLSCLGKDEPTYQEHYGKTSVCSTSSIRSEGCSFDSASGIYSSSNASNYMTPLTRRHQMGRSRTSSTQSSYLQTLSDQVVSYHFCQSDNAPTCLIPEFVHSLAAQLSQSPKLTAYFDMICNDGDLQSLLSLQSCISDPSRAFLQGIIDPLNNLKRLGKLGNGCRTYIMLIDGLCAGEVHKPDHGDTIASFISNHLTKLPHWLKIVCTVRSDMQDIIKTLPFQKICLDKTDVDERLNKDVADYILMRIMQSPTIQTNITPISIKPEIFQPESRFTQYMVQTSHGSFLYVKLILNLIERGHLVIKSSTSFNVLPMSLEEIFRLEFNLRFPSYKSFERVQEILAISSAALYPMTLIELFQTVNALRLSKDDNLQWGEFLMRFSSLNGFLVRRSDDSLMFFHPAFRDWLIRRNQNTSKCTKFLCDPRVGHAAIASKISRIEAPLNPDKTLELGHHILKAHIYRNLIDESFAGRDLQSVWVANASEDVSMALGSMRNVSCPNVKVSRLLLLAGASPNFLSDFLDEAPLLGVFAFHGFVDMINLLLEFGADVNAVNTTGMTPIMFAAKQGHLDIVRLFVNNGGHINVVDKSDQSALIHATLGGHLNVVAHLATADWNTDAKNDLGLQEAVQQAVIAASKSGHSDILEYLLDMPEVSVNNADTLYGETALCAAAGAGDKKCCEILLKRGAQVSASNLREIPPLQCAILGGHWDITDLLLREKADLEQTDNVGRTALIVAAMEGHLGILELLISREASLEAKDSKGLSALSWACQKGQAQVAACLLEHQGQNLSINQIDSSGQTPLDFAAQNGNPELVQLLLDKGANMEHVDLNGMRPLDKAIAKGNGPAVSCFLKKGAKLGPTTWNLAQHNNEIMLILLNKLLEDGNTLYRRDQLDAATHRYQYALKRVPNTPKHGELQITSHEDQVFEQLKIHLLLNLSKCHRKMGDFDGAADSAGEVLKFRPNSLEALHARARANREAGNYEAAVQDLAEALKISPQNRDVHKVMIKVKEELKQSSSHPISKSQYYN